MIIQLIAISIVQSMVTNQCKRQDCIITSKSVFAEQMYNRQNAIVPSYYFWFKFLEFNNGTYQTLLQSVISEGNGLTFNITAHISNFMVRFESHDSQVYQKTILINIEHKLTKEWYLFFLKFYDFDVFTHYRNLIIQQNNIYFDVECQLQDTFMARSYITPHYNSDIAMVICSRVSNRYQLSFQELVNTCDIKNKQIQFQIPYLIQQYEYAYLFENSNFQVTFWLRNRYELLDLNAEIFSINSYTYRIQQKNAQQQVFQLFRSQNSYKAVIYGPANNIQNQLQLDFDMIDLNVWHLFIYQYQRNLEPPGKFIMKSVKQDYLQSFQEQQILTDSFLQFYNEYIITNIVSLNIGDSVLNPICQPNCLICDTIDSFNCLQCKGNRILQNGQCYCPEYYLIDFVKEDCKCISSYYQDLPEIIEVNIQEVSCPEGYEICQEENIKCQVGYYIQNSNQKCIKCNYIGDSIDMACYLYPNLDVTEKNDYSEYILNGQQTGYLQGSTDTKPIKLFFNSIKLHTIDREDDDFQHNLQQRKIKECKQNEGLHEGNCIQCPQYCFTCVLDKDQFRCTSCIDYPKYYLTLSGYCQLCLLKDCEVCYQYSQNDFGLISLSKLTYSDELYPVNACAKCRQNMTYNYDTKKCEPFTSKQQCGFACIIDNQTTCLIEPISQKYVQTICQINYCKLCHSGMCIQCFQGYYLNELNECIQCEIQYLINCYTFQLEFQNYDYSGIYIIQLIHKIVMKEQYSYNAVRYNNCIEFKSYLGNEFCFNYNGSYQLVEGSKRIMVSNKYNVTLPYMCQNKNYRGIRNHDECFQIVNNNTRFAINHLGSPILCDNFRICSNYLKYKVYFYICQIITDGQFIYANNAKYNSIDAFVNSIRKLQYFNKSINSIELQVDITKEHFYFQTISWNMILQYNGSLDINISLTQLLVPAEIIYDTIAFFPAAVIIGKYKNVYLYNYTTHQHINLNCTGLARFDDLNLICSIHSEAPTQIIQNLTQQYQDLSRYTQFKIYGNFHHQQIYMSNIRLIGSYYEDLLFIGISSVSKSVTLLINDLSITDCIFWKRSVLLQIEDLAQKSTLEISNLVFRNLSLYNSVNFFGSFKTIKLRNVSIIDCYFNNSILFQPLLDLTINELTIKNLTIENGILINSQQQPNSIFLNALQIIDSYFYNSSLIQYTCTNTSISNMTVTNVKFKKAQFITVKAHIIVLNSCIINNVIGIVSLFSLDSKIIRITNIEILSEVDECQNMKTSIFPYMQIQSSGSIIMNNLQLSGLCLYSSFLTISNSNHQIISIDINNIQIKDLNVLIADDFISCYAKDSHLQITNILIQKIKLQSWIRISKFNLIYLIAANATIENLQLIDNDFDSGRQNSYFYICANQISIKDTQITNHDYQVEIIGHIETEEFYLKNSNITFFNNKSLTLSAKEEYLILLTVPKFKNIILVITLCQFDFDYQAGIHSSFINIQQQNGTVLIRENRFRGLNLKSHSFTFATFMGNIKIIQNIFVNHNSGLFDIEFRDQSSQLNIEKLYVSRQGECKINQDRNLIRVRNGEVNLSELNIINLCFTGILLEHNLKLVIQTVLVKRSLETNNILNINAIQSNHVEINNLSLTENIQLKSGLIKIINLFYNLTYKVNNVTLTKNICQYYCLQMEGRQGNELNQRMLEISHSLRMSSIVILQNIANTLVSIHYLQLTMIDTFLYSSEQQKNQTTVTYVSKSEQLSFYDSKIYISENGLQLNFSKLALSNTMILNVKTQFYFGKYRQIMVSLDDGNSMLSNQRVSNTTDQTYYDQAKVLIQNILYDKFYIPTGQQFNQYQRLNLLNLQYEDYIIKFKVKIVNQFGFINMKDDTDCQLNIYNTNGDLKSEISLTNENLSQFQVTYPPLSKLLFKISCHQKDEDPLFVVFNTKIFPCQVGEILNNNQCLRCQSQLSLYSVQLKAQYCKYQDFVKITEVQSGLINLRKSFWRPSLTNGIIEECSQIQECCRGGWNAGDQSCEIGYLGALCSQCDLYNIYGHGQYQKGQNTQCRQCEFGYSIIWKIFIILIMYTFIISIVNSS